MSFSGITAVSTLPVLYYFLTLQVQSTFFSCTINVIAETKPKCHDEAGCHQMEVSFASSLFLYCNRTAILFCKYYRGVYYFSHLFILLYHLRALRTGVSGLCCALSTSKGQRNQTVNTLMQVVREVSTEE